MENNYGFLQEQGWINANGRLSFSISDREETIAVEQIQKWADSIEFVNDEEQKENVLTVNLDINKMVQHALDAMVLLCDPTDEEYRGLHILHMNKVELLKKDLAEALRILNKVEYHN